MTALVHDLASAVLGLPPDGRARMLELLIASFEPQSEAQSAWMELASQRRDDVLQGREAMVSGADALTRVRARIG